MGNCFSDPQARQRKYETDATPAPEKPHIKKQSMAASVPDFSLGSQFQVQKLLGRGGEGETWLCKDNSNQELVAIKFIKRPIPKAVLQIIKREIQIQADLGQGHLNIVAANEVVLTASHLGLVMEYVNGGNMVNYVSKKRETREQRGGLALDEVEARYFFKQILAAVEFCHKNQVAHRDLKLDNTLLKDTNPQIIKLCDFGFAKHWQADSSHMDTMRIGTPEYMGPELISSRHGYDGKKVDIWACGVLLFVMLLGKFPFESVEDQENGSTAGMYDIWLQQVKTNWRDHPQNTHDGVKLTVEVKDLLDKMFEVKQDNRISIENIKKHPWFNMPLTPKYQSGWDQLQAQQVALTQNLENNKINFKNRDEALEALVSRASQAGLPSCQPVRLKLVGPDANNPKLPPDFGYQLNSMKEEEE